MEVNDMKPSDIVLTVPPLVGVFGKSEVENAAALLLWHLAHTGDTWRPVTFEEIWKTCSISSEPTGWLRDMLVNPFIKFSFGQAVEEGILTADRVFTDKAKELLFYSRWRNLQGLEELEYIREMEKKAEQRAVEMWRQGHPEREHVLPGRENLVLFLLERLDKLENRLVWYCPGCHEVGPIAKDQHKGQTCLCCFCEKAQAVIVSIPEALAGWDAR